MAKTHENEIEKLKKESDAFDENIKSLTLDRMNEAPLHEVEPQTKLSQKEIEKSKDIYLKPVRVIADGQKFNEAYREKWNEAKEYVQFIAEHKEIIGETIDIWTHPFGGVGAEYWQVPTGRPIWGPRHLAEQIRHCNYHRLTMKQDVISERNGYGAMYGALAVDSIVQRLTAEPVIGRKSIFMGAAA